MSVSRKSTTPNKDRKALSELQSALKACNNTIAQLKALKGEILGENLPENIPPKVQK